MQGLREICDRHGILLIADEVMSGFGRTGKWFAVDHWGVVPDLITMAKGLTSAYVQLGAVGMRPQIARAFQEKAFPGGLTYNSHTLACATALATIAVYEDEKAHREARRGWAACCASAWTSWRASTPRWAAARNIGLFGIVELVRNRNDLRAHGALQRHLGGDGGPRRSSSASRASTPSCAGTPSSPTRRSSSPRRSSTRGWRSSTAGSRSRTAPSRLQRRRSRTKCTTVGAGAPME